MCFLLPANNTEKAETQRISSKMKLIRKLESATGETQCINNFHKETTAKTWHILRLLYDVSTETIVAELNPYFKLISTIKAIRLWMSWAGFPWKLSDCHTKEVGQCLYSHIFLYKLHNHLAFWITRQKVFFVQYVTMNILTFIC